MGDIAPARIDAAGGAEGQGGSGFLPVQRSCSFLRSQGAVYLGRLRGAAGPQVGNSRGVETAGFCSQARPYRGILSFEADCTRRSAPGDAPGCPPFSAPSIFTFAFLCQDRILGRRPQPSVSVGALLGIARPGGGKPWHLRAGSVARV